METPQAEFPELLKMALSSENFFNENMNSLEAKLVYVLYSSHEGHYVLPLHHFCLT